MGCKKGARTCRRGAGWTVTSTPNQLLRQLLESFVLPFSCLERDVFHSFSLSLA